MLLVNSRVKITLNDSRVIVGQLLAFDKYMNLVVADSEEYRRTKRAKAGEMSNENGTVKRTLGFIVLRGESIVSCSLESGAPASGFENKARVPAAQQMAPGMRPVNQTAAAPPPMMMPAMMMRPGMMMPPGMTRPQ